MTFHFSTMVGMTANSEIYASLLRLTKYPHATTNQLLIYNPDNLRDLMDYC